jgi:hypothetical protein
VPLESSGTAPLFALLDSPTTDVHLDLVDHFQRKLGGVAEETGKEISKKEINKICLE